ncbi:Fanconi anemia group F protein [Stegostoma tigrinum]|uniref:Fanconi anemia group F protein n=1 Tax=Stegostoma tigrinum TaxID=3053191 RepID=UPI00202B35F1|nr:Fanconi anemia group F protein [Stegostoma tigrinum]
METVLEYLSRFAEVLAVAHSPWAADWDDAEVGRAFQWASYLEQLSRRLEGAGSVEARAALRQRLQEQRRLRPRAPPELPRYRDLLLEELGRGGELLSEALLHNPAASASAFHRAASWYRSAGSGRTGGGGPEALSASLGRAVRVKAATWLLRRAWGSEPPRGSVDVVSETGGQILRERLEERLKVQGRELPEGQAAAYEELLQRAVPGGDGEEEPGSFQPLAALLLETTEGNDGSEARARALGWLLGDGRALATLCRALPCSQLAALTARRPAFGRRYLRLLQRWGWALRYDAARAEWAPPCAEEPSWCRLLEHFAALWQGPPPVREAAESQLRSLKAADGDFEVPGVSVWTDLLLALTR